MYKLVNHRGEPNTASNASKRTVCSCCGSWFSNTYRELAGDATDLRNPALIGINMYFTDKPSEIQDREVSFGTGYRSNGKELVQTIKHHSIPLDDGTFLNLETVHV